MERPEIDRSVERRIVDGISATPARSGGGVRTAPAGVLTAGVFGAIAAFGGVSYATNSVRYPVGVGTNTGWSYAPSCDQYGHQGKEPGRPVYNPPGFNKGGKKGGSGGYFGGFGW